MTVRSNIKVSIDAGLVARLRDIKSKNRTSVACLTEQAIEAWLDQFHPICGEHGCMPADRESIRQASAAFEPLGRWDVPSGGSITAKSWDKQGRKIQYNGVYIDEIVTLHSVWISGFKDKIYTLSDILTPEEFEEVNSVLTIGMQKFMEYRAFRN